MNKARICNILQDNLSQVCIVEEKRRGSCNCFRLRETTTKDNAWFLISSWFENKNSYKICFGNK